MLHQLVCLLRRPNSSPGSPFGICGGQRDTGRVLSQSTFLCQPYSSSFRLLTEKQTGESWGRFSRSNALSEIEERKKAAFISRFVPPVILRVSARACESSSQNIFFLSSSKLLLQGGSNMTGTDLCVNKPHKSRSYLNHLVHATQ